nr:hypothetical protein [Microcystis aeruginosa]
MRIGKNLHPTPHTPHPTPCPYEKLFQQTLCNSCLSIETANTLFLDIPYKLLTF